MIITRFDKIQCSLHSNAILIIHIFQFENNHFIEMLRKTSVVLCFEVKC